MENPNYTTEQLEQMLADRKKEEKKQAERAKKEYEQKRDQMVDKYGNEAFDIFQKLTDFKSRLASDMELQKEALDVYGTIRSNSKGGFSVLHSNGELKITRRRDTMPTWDERSDKAVELIKDFLSDTVKKRDKNLYEILLTFIEKNKKGDLEYSKVMDLLSHEEKYDDPRWKQGLKLIKESYQSNFRGYGYEISIKDQDGKFQRIELNFSSI